MINTHARRNLRRICLASIVSAVVVTAAIAMGETASGAPHRDTVEGVSVLSDKSVEQLAAAGVVGTPVEDLAPGCQQRVDEGVAGPGCTEILAFAAGAVPVGEPMDPPASESDLIRARAQFTCTGSPCYGTQNRDQIQGLQTAGTAIYGRAGNDDLFGWIYPDWLVGEGGDDLLSLNGGDDLATGNAGDDDIDCLNGSDRLVDANGNAYYGLDGTDNADKIAGDDGADYLVGGNGWDTLRGGTGNDVLVGTGDGGDPDDLYGGSGNDDCLPGQNDTVHDC